MSTTKIYLVLVALKRAPTKIATINLPPTSCAFQARRDLKTFANDCMDAGGRATQEQLPSKNCRDAIFSAICTRMCIARLKHKWIQIEGSLTQPPKSKRMLGAHKGSVKPYGFRRKKNCYGAEILLDSLAIKKFNSEYYTNRYINILCVMFE